MHTLVETVSVEGEPAPRGEVLATNAYRRGPRGWEMILHHASAQAPAARGAGEAPSGTVH